MFLGSKMGHIHGIKVHIHGPKREQNVGKLPLMFLKSIMRKPFLILKERQHSSCRTGLFPRYTCLSAALLSQRDFFWRVHFKKSNNRKQLKLNTWIFELWKSLSLGEVEGWTETSELESSSNDKKKVTRNRFWEAHHRTFYLHQQFPLE